MKLRTRLIISFCIIIFVPVVIAFALISGFHLLQNNPSAGMYSLMTDYQNLTNSLQILSEKTQPEYDYLLEIQKKNPDCFSSQASLRRINDRMNKKYSYIVVRIENEIVYQGGKDTNLPIYELPDYGKSNAQGTVAVYLDGDTPALLRQIDFVNTKGQEGSLFMISVAKNILPEVKKILWDLAFSLILILMFTAVILIIWTYSGIIPKVRQLTKAADNIRDGNLDFEIDTKGKDELSELSRAFEDMRCRLATSAQEKLDTEQEQKMLLSNIAHDLKTPITAIKGYSEGILDGVADTPEKQERYLKTIFNKANEMNNLINELTLYSKIDTNRIPYHFQKISVSEYFNDCATELRMDLENQQVQMSYINYVDGKEQMIADPEQLTRVIHNIFNNSIKYMGDKKERYIHLRVEDVGDFIQVEIEDNGKGISVKDLPYIFDRFYRADASRNSAAGGSGIGLSIVKKIVEDHGGKIWATSKEDVGTTMYFVIRKYQEVANE